MHVETPRLRALVRGLWQPVARRDARVFQVAFLSAFLAFVLAYRDYTLPPLSMAVVVAGCLATQEVAARLSQAPASGYLSPLISALSLCLLLRTGSPWTALLAAVLSIASKFVIRYRGKHVFNPTNFGLLVTVALTGDAWVASSQWGSGALLAFLIAALGMAVAGRASRLDIALAFLVAHLGLKLARVLWLGQRIEVFEHQALSGALILFAFFMISDPRSTPDARAGRIVFAALVALVAHVLQFRLFWTEAPLWALLFLSPLTPVIDRLLPAARFEWRAGGEPHVEAPVLDPAGAR